MVKPSFFSELKRRQIYRGGVMYVVAGWVVVQVATQVFPYFDIPNWAIRLVVVAILHHANANAARPALDAMIDWAGKQP